MRIGVDARPLVAAKTGIGHYVQNVLNQLAEIDETNEYYLYSHLPIPGKLSVSYRHIRAANTSASHFWLQSKLPFWMIQDKIDLFWGGGYAAPLAGYFLKRWKTVITVHDLVAQRYPDTLPWKLRYHMQWGLPAYMGIADRILADSENTAKDIEEFHGVAGNKVEVIPLAAAQRFLGRMDEEENLLVLNKYGLQPGYLLYVGTIEPRKGVDTILRALAILHSHWAGPVNIPQLVLVGKIGWKTEAIVALPEQLGISDWVQFLYYVADDDLPALYQGAKLFLYPSFYEGFGLPVLEAMASGTPVVTSTASSLPEVAGNAAAYVNPGDEVELARIVEQCLVNDELRAQMRRDGLEQAHRFSWRRTAEQTLKAFEECLR